MEILYSLFDCNGRRAEFLSFDKGRMAFSVHDRLLAVFA